jgi:flagellar biosynthetic protein FliP
MQTKRITFALVVAATVLPLCALAQGLPALTSTPAQNGGQNYTLSLQTMLLLTGLTFLPAALLMMTSFTRIIIVLSLLRQALGTQGAPPNQVIVGLALFLSFFVMGPVLEDLHHRLPAAIGKQDHDAKGARDRRGTAQRIHAATDPPGRSRAVRKTVQ